MKDKSKCPNCLTTSFEGVNEIPAISEFESTFLRYNSYKVVAGVTDLCNVRTVVKKIVSNLNINFDKSTAIDNR